MDGLVTTQAETLRNALRDTPTRRFLFIGHADAPVSAGEPAARERTLGFAARGAETKRLQDACSLCAA